VRFNRTKEHLMWAAPIKSGVSEGPAKPKVAVLLNSNARRVSRRVIKSLGQVVPASDLFLSRSELDARRIAIAVVDAGFDTVFLGGGDGTMMCFINEIQNQVFQRRQFFPTAMPRFGVLRLGTGNSVASLVKASKGQGFVDDILKARSGEVPGYRTVELLQIEGRRAPFAGLGIDGKLLNDYVWVKEHFGKGPLSPFLRGPGGYVASVALKTVPHYLTHSTEVNCRVVNGNTTAYRMGPDGSASETFAPGAEMYSGALMMAAAGTVPFYGFELKMFPFAATRKGMMNLRLGMQAPASILANLQKLWNGTWFPDGIKDYLVHDCTISFDREMPFQLAGDAQGYRRELKFAVARESVELVDFTALH
jgi:diacylglycerol kinase family enzyme